MAKVPELRRRLLNDAPVNPEGDYVLYWMVAFRRTHYNFALERAVEWARELKRPVLVFEALRVGYPWASDRLHTFILQGMADQHRRLADRPGVTYLPYVERAPGAGRGLLEALAARAAVVVTDDFPSFFLPRMQASAAGRLKVRMETVDSNGLLPVAAPQVVFARAHDFRRYLQRSLPDHFQARPTKDPLARFRVEGHIELPKKLVRKWAPATIDELSNPASLVADLPLDHSVVPARFAGGATEARRCATTFMKERLSAYGDGRNHPDEATASGLSPWLHFGHLSTHELFQGIIDREQWSPDAVAPKATGSREGWWGMSLGAESFLDELVTWRELGFNMSSKRADYMQYDSLPEWARKTLQQHADDPREYVYDLETFERAHTHDEIWNAAQTELVRTGRMHNYLRMLWGKKILEWTARPQDALQIMEELNNKYAVDGRNPNSYSGIFWVLGRYDRAWGPERPIYGKIRYMSSDNTKKKIRMKRYLSTYGGGKPVCFSRLCGGWSAVSRLPGTVTPQAAARQAEMLGNRVKKRLRKQQPRFERQGIRAFRLYDRDIPEIRAAVDWYDGHVVIAGYARAQTDALPDWLDRMGEGVRAALGLDADRVHLKTRRTQPKDGPRYERLARTERRLVIEEAGLKFWVNLEDYIDTGLFLDHRQMRARVRAEAEGEDFLNLYGYTGSFTCYAAAGGARSTTTVDQSSAYLDWMVDNLGLNGLGGPGDDRRSRHKAVATSVEAFVARARRDGQRWTLAVLDPPSRSTVGGPDGRGLDVQRDHRWLVDQTLSLLRRGGTLYFSTNHQRFSPDLDGLGARVEEITAQTVPEDFQPHQPHRAWRLLA